MRAISIPCIWTWGTNKIFDKNTPLNTVVSLGNFDAGTELVLRLYVRNTGLNFFTGDPTRNIDGLPHALAVTTLLQGGSYLTTVGFEDLRGGGDKDYNDFMFSLTNVVDPPPGAVPEPSVLLLLGCGLAGLYFQRRKLRLYSGWSVHLTRASRASRLSPAGPPHRQAPAYPSNHRHALPAWAPCPAPAWGPAGWNTPAARSPPAGTGARPTG